MGVGQPDRLHRPEPQGLATARGHHLDGQATLEVGRVALPVVEFDRVGGQQRVDEGLELCVVQGAVDVVLARAARSGLVVARLEPRDRHVDGLGVNDRGNGVEEGEVVFAGQFQDRLGQCRRGEGARGDDHAIPVGRRQARDLAPCNLDQRVFGQGLGDLLGEPVPIDREGPAGRHLVGVGSRHHEGTEDPHFGMQNADRIVLGSVGAGGRGTVASVARSGRISCRTTGTPARAICQAASLPANPPPIT